MSDAANDFQVFVTASEAWPAFERAVLAAQDEVIGGFRIFDLGTPLLSDEAREIGTDWFDLLAYVLKRGVRVTLRITDFDPVMGTVFHKATWRTMRQAAALQEVAGQGAVLDVTPERHPTRAGALPATAFAPLVWARLRKARKQESTREAPGLEGRSANDLSPVTHHQKLAVMDGTLLYIGGLDLDRRRLDTPAHDRPAGQTWSDVQVMVRGPAVVEAREHLLTFRDVCAGRAKPAPVAHLARTLSAPRRFQLPFLSPRSVVSEIEDVHREAFGRALHLIHIETQYFRASRIAEAMAEAAQKTPDLRAIVVLPDLPEEVAFGGNEDVDARHGLALEADALQIIQEAFGDWLLLASPVQPRLAPREDIATVAGSPTIHVHNKVLVIDDSFAFVGSANLNGRSLAWDTEVGLRIPDAAHVGRLRWALIDHWWGDMLPEGGFAPETAQQVWSREVEQNAMRLPEHRKGLLVPFDHTSGEDLRQRVPGGTEDVV